MSGAPFLYLLGCVLILCIWPSLAYKGHRVPDALMEYVFSGQRNDDIYGTQCADMPSIVAPNNTFSNLNYFGTMLINTANNSNECVSSYMKEHTGLRIRSEPDTGNERWRVKSADPYTLPSSFTLEMWVNVSSAFSYQNIIGLFSSILDTPDIYDATVDAAPGTYTKFASPQTPNFLDHDQFYKYSSIDAGCSEYNLDTSNLRLSLTNGELNLDMKNYVSNPQTYGSLFLDRTLPFPNAEVYNILHISITVNYVSVLSESVVKIYVNGTEANTYVTVSFRVDTTIFPSDLHVQFGHQFKTGGNQDMDLLFFAIYDHALSSVDLEKNFNAWLPNSAPVMSHNNTIMDEDTCAQLTFNSSDFDTFAMDNWVDYMQGKYSVSSYSIFYQTYTPRASEVDPLPRYFVSSLPADGTLYTDSGCTTPAIVLTQEQHATATPGEIDAAEVINLYYKPPANAFGIDYTNFKMYASDGQEYNGEGPDSDPYYITINNLPDPPTTQNIFVTDSWDNGCNMVTLTGEDIDGIDDIAGFELISMCTITTSGTNPSCTIYTDASCTSAAAANTLYPITNPGERVLYVKNINTVDVSGSAIFGTMSFDFKCVDKGSASSAQSTATMTLNNPWTATQPNVQTVTEDVQYQEIYMPGMDESGLGRTLQARIGSLPTSGTLYKSSGSNYVTVSIGDIVSADCAGSATDPCVYYSPNNNLFGDNLDSFTFAIYSPTFQLGQSALTNITVTNVPDYPVFTCSSTQLTNIKAGNFMISDNFALSVSDIDSPTKYERYNVTISGDSHLIEFSLSNGRQYPQCQNHNTCCDVNCEIVTDIDVFDYGLFASKVQFYSSFQSINDILSNITVRSSHMTNYGTGQINITISDFTGLTDSCITTFVVQQPDPVAYVTQPVTATVDEESSVTINLLGGDASLLNTPMLANIKALPQYGGVLTDFLGNVLAVGDTVDDLSCFENSAPMPCVIYTPDADFFGQDSFQYSISLSQTEESDIGFVTLTINNLPDAPIITCPSILYSNIQAGNFEKIDSTNVTISDIDAPSQYERYHATITGDASLIEMSLPNGVSYTPRCATSALCCDTSCEFFVQSGDAFTSGAYQTSVEFYAGWNAMQDILSLIQVRAISPTTYGSGVITVTIEDASVLTSQCTIDFDVQQPDPVAMVTQPVTANTIEESSVTINLLGYDASLLSTPMTANIVSLPMHGKLYDNGQELSVGDTVDDLTCFENSAPMPCVSYIPDADFFGEDYFQYSISLTPTEESTIGFANITVTNTPDAPVLTCPDTVFTNLAAGDYSMMDTAIVTVTDVDQPNQYARYYVNITGDELKVKFSLPQGADMVVCAPYTSCCSSTCDMSPQSGHVYDANNIFFEPNVAFYASFEAMQIILSEIVFTNGNASDYGMGNFTIYVEDETALSTSCMIDFRVAQPQPDGTTEEPVVVEPIVTVDDLIQYLTGPPTSWQAYVFYVIILLILIVTGYGCFRLVRRIRNKSSSGGDNRQHVEQETRTNNADDLILNDFDDIGMDRL